MSIGVVDPLKAVQINVHQAYGPVPPMIVNVLVKVSAVVQSGEEIRIGAFQNLAFQIAFRGNIPKNTKFSNHMVENIVNRVLMDLQHLFRSIP